MNIYNKTYRNTMIFFSIQSLLMKSRQVIILQSDELWIQEKSFLCYTSSAPFSSSAKHNLCMEHYSIDVF